jgi:hypothetical protein
MIAIGEYPQVEITAGFRSCLCLSNKATWARKIDWETDQCSIPDKKGGELHIDMATGANTCCAAHAEALILEALCVGARSGTILHQVALM